MDSEKTTAEELVARFKAGDEQAFEQLLLNLQPLIEKFVRKYTCGRNYDFAEDIRQVAQIGIMEAAWAFQPARGIRFMTYVPFRILGSVRDFMRRNSTIQIPRLLATEARKAGHFTLVRLDCPARMTDAGQAISVIQDIPDARASNPLNELLHIDDRDILFWSLSRLPEPARTSLAMRLEDKTMKSIGQAVGVCESRISQLMPGYLLALAAVVQARLGQYKPDDVPITDGEQEYMYLVRRHHKKFEQAADLKRSPRFIYKHGSRLHGTIMLSVAEKKIKAANRSA